MPDDPRNAAMETKMTMPKSWKVGEPDAMGSVSMLMAGATMVVRNKYLGWAALLLGIASALNQTPMRTKESSTGGMMSGIIFALGALFATYVPMLIITPRANTMAGGQQPLP